MGAGGGDRREAHQPATRLPLAAIIIIMSISLSYDFWNGNNDMAQYMGWGVRALSGETYDEIEDRVDDVVSRLVQRVNSRVPDQPQHQQHQHHADHNKSSLSLLNYWSWYPPHGSDMSVVLNTLCLYCDEQREWDYSDDAEVCAFFRALVRAARRTDLPASDPMDWQMPEPIILSFSRLFDDTYQKNRPVYQRIVVSSAPQRIFSVLWLVIELQLMPFSLTEALYHVGSNYVRLMAVFLRQPLLNTLFLTADFVRSLCRSAITVLTTIRSDDMKRDFLPDFVPTKRPLLKQMLVALLSGPAVHLLTEADVASVKDHMQRWFTFHGDLCHESALSLELDHIEPRLFDLLQRRKEERERKRTQKKQQKERTELRESEVRETDARCSVKKQRLSPFSILVNTSVHAIGLVPESDALAVVSSASTLSASSSSSSGSGDEEKLMMMAISAADPMPRFRCDRCPASYDRPSDLQRHKLRHGAGDRHVCSSCDYSARNPSAVTEHQKVHTHETRIIYLDE